ncbi:MAG TPA: zinc metallopeptidase [Lentisphaeria bacterium]|nr:MAG: zinc metallopeptidase [Lentisphaerae bacterium GWF2_38_69]HBM16351.1 zinc metallopeptidase [Lentisphaeria bacterium]
MFYFDPMYLIFAVPGLILALMASFYTKSTFAKYSQVGASTGLSGAMAAKRMLQYAGIYDVKIEEVSGFMSDHYDPTTKTLRLSPDVFKGKSLSSMGVACHEAGHAIQHARGYAPLKLRTMMVPMTNICSTMSYFIIFLGFVMSKELILVGAILFSVAVLFSIITLPVEWDASARAKEMLVSAGIVTPNEARMSGEVLNAAFLTYVAAAVSAILTLLYYLLRSGVFGGRDE